MDTPAPTSQRVSEVAVPRPRTATENRVALMTAYAPLAAETRHSAMLLGGALGLMAAFAITLLLLTTRLGGAA